MNTCNTCKWWNVEKMNENLNPPGESPQRIGDWFKNSGVCEHPKLQFQNDENKNDGFDCLDIDAYREHASGSTITGAKFGCIHHEPNQNNSQADSLLHDIDSLYIVFKLSGKTKEEFEKLVLPKSKPLFYEMIKAYDL